VLAVTTDATEAIKDGARSEENLTQYYHGGVIYRVYSEH
jgi:hypothetical protein